MGKLLTIDLGNTRAKAGVFLHGKLIRRVLFERTNPEPLKKLFTSHKIEEAILGSVVENQAAIERIVSNYTRLNTLQSITRFPIRNNYKTPETLGADRLACAVGASVLFPGKNVLSIDAGTCIKYDIVDRNGVYLGGSISPGIAMRFTALHTFTGKLPLVVPAPFKGFIGKDTRTSILTGVVQGAIYELEGFVRRYKKEFPGLKIILTGGDAPRLAKHLNFSIFASPDLVLVGLNRILEYDIATRK
jgi:type III pantothenate kinase